METPLFTPRTEELRSERNRVERSMAPLTVEMLKRLREEGALESRKRNNSIVTRCSLG